MKSNFSHKYWIFQNSQKSCSLQFMQFVVLMVIINNIFYYVYFTEFKTNS